MAVIATGSKHSRNNNYIVAVMCIVFALWFGYDGWINPEYQAEHLLNDKGQPDPQGRPDPNLQFNRYSPIALGVAAIYFLWAAAAVSKRQVQAGEQGVTVGNKPMIPYEHMLTIDKRAFEKEGHFTLEYTAEGQKQRLKLSDRTYDNLGPLLDEVVKRTGAKPVEAPSQG